jgi:4-hydroxybenzoate polyprenyltransferase
MGHPANPLSSEPTVRGQGSPWRALLESLRPTQCVKNGFVFAALIFSRSLMDWHRTGRVAAAAALFCLVSGAGYLFNDILDASEDRQHPVKRSRPVASGRLSVRGAAWGAGLLAVAALGGAWVLDREFFLVTALYGILNGLYSWFLKRVMLLDVFVIATGFVLRVVGGGVVIHVEISAWLIVCTTLLALFFWRSPSAGTNWFCSAAMPPITGRSWRTTVRIFSIN